MVEVSSIAFVAVAAIIFSYFAKLVYDEVQKWKEARRKKEAPKEEEKA